MSAADEGGPVGGRHAAAAYRRSPRQRFRRRSGKRVEECVDVVVGRRPPDAGAQRAVGVDAHRGEHRRRFERLARARRARVHRDAALIEREQDRLRLDAVDAEAHEVGQARVRDRRSARRRRRSPIAPCGRAASDERPFARSRRRPRRRAAAPKPTIAGTSSMPGAPGALLRAADDERREAEAAPHQECRRALGAAEGVAGDRAEVGAEGGEVDGDVTGGRARVDVDDARRACARTRSTTAAAGCSVPTSWLASCTDTSAVSGRSAAATSSAIEPTERGRRRTVRHVGRARATASSTDECSTAVVTTWPPPAAGAARPRPRCSPPRCRWR